jgi:HAD superfamily hydrolase (TIGR01509 family)
MAAWAVAKWIINPIGFEPQEMHNEAGASQPRFFFVNPRARFRFFMAFGALTVILRAVRTTIKAVIFDMDGVLTDSEPLINAAAVAMFKEKGLAVRPEDFHPFIGAGENRYIGGVAEKYHFPLEIAAAKQRTYEIYLELIPTRLQAFPGATDLVRRCQAAGCKVAVASSADRIKIEANLNKIGLPVRCWDAIVCAEDVGHKKPAPDIFLAAARKLNLPPGECVVIEDAVNGIQAAKAAGMRCVAVAQSFAPDKLREADMIRENIAQVQMADLLEPA